MTERLMIERAIGRLKAVREAQKRIKEEAQRLKEAREQRITQGLRES